MALRSPITSDTPKTRESFNAYICRACGHRTTLPLEDFDYRSGGGGFFSASEA
jgi:hypothetical protein